VEDFKFAGFYVNQCLLQIFCCCDRRLRKIVYLSMIKNKKILLKIKQLIGLAEPNATVILFGSHARGQNDKQSDIDVLILVDNDKITYSDEQRIKYPLYDLEFETGKIISPVIFSRNDWESRHTITPFYKNIKKEGIML